jgi:sodium transport system permease protein
MSWSNVSVIFRREVRDQLRDRRTLFMIFVLPILLYPLLGTVAIQFRAAFEQKPRRVVVVGAEHLPPEPPLLNPARTGFDPGWFESATESRRLVVETYPAADRWLDPGFRQRATRAGAADAVVTVPDDLVEQIETKGSPTLAINYDSADEKSQITYLRLKDVVDRWQKAILNRRLAQDKLPPNYTEPVKVKPVDVATPAETGGTLWAKLFPFLLVMMSLTGAFYPAIDLCAGEKERGTMETLLISPASRAEIVVGKYLTVLLASVMTALLNLVSMALTGIGIARQLGSAAAGAAAGGGRAEAVFTPPTLESAFWIVLLLVPLASFFSAICLALAVLARSMKEGQYYMTPLYLVSLPLIFLTLFPGIEINPFYSLVPITGVSLLLRALLLGDYAVAAHYFVPVLATTIAYGLIALQWAIDQFRREDVLFREAERFDLRVWVKHLLRDKEPTPNGGEALLCFVLMVTLAWFTMQYLLASRMETSAAGMAGGQLAFVLTPPAAMAFLLTSSPRRTLRLYWPRGKFLWIAAALAFAVNPLVNELRPWVEWLFPMSDEMRQAMERLMENIPDLPTALLLFAVIPAVCEEAAFRGFILSGLERGHTARTAVVMSALLFGFSHVLFSLFQQLFNATLLGLILGLLALRSRSLAPGIVFHALNNGLAVLIGTWAATASGARYAPWLFRKPSEALYHYPLVAVAAAASAALLVVLLRSRDAAPGEPPAEAENLLVAAGGSSAAG